MPRFNDQDYQRLAKAITKDHVDEKVPLSDGFQKAARDCRMNAHEATRLLQATNVTAHLELFDKMGSARYVEFDALEPDDELPKLFDGGVETSEKVAEAWELGLELPDERWERLREGVEKVAAAEVPVEEARATPGPYDGERGWNALRLAEKTAEEVAYRLRVAYLDYEEELEKLATLFRRVDAMDYPEFEKDAVALYPDAEPVIAKLREMTRRAPEPLEKQATRYVITRREHEALEGVMCKFREARDYANAYQVIKDKTPSALLR